MFASPSIGSTVFSCSLIWLAVSGPACAQDPPVSLEIRVDARAVAPGEPLRIRVDADAPLDALEATLLGEEIYLTPADTSGRSWSG